MKTFILIAGLALSIPAFSSPFEDYDDYNIVPLPGEFMIQAVHSGKCLDIKSKSKDEGANVQQYRCKSSKNQLFRAQVTIFDDAPYFSFINVNSGLSIAIQPYTLGDRSDNVYQIENTIYTNEEVVLWSLIPTSGGDAFLIRSFDGSAGCLDVVHKETDNGANVQVFAECHGGLNQQFKFLPVE